MPSQKCFDGNTFRNLLFGFGLVFVTLGILLNLFWNEILNEIIKNGQIVIPCSKLSNIKSSVTVLSFEGGILSQAFHVPFRDSVFELKVADKLGLQIQKYFNMLFLKGKSIRLAGAVASVLGLVGKRRGQFLVPLNSSNNPNTQLELSASSKSHALWIRNPFPLHVDFYFFNWTNPTDLKQSVYKPNFTEIGPYRFREEIEKVNVQWNRNNTVTYRKLRRWYFEENESKGSLDDTITNLNIVALTAARSTKYWNRLGRIPLSVTLSSTQKLYISKKVRELLFEGFSDPLIDFASKIPSLSTQVPFDRFGWFYKRNDSSEFDGIFNVETGADGLASLGRLKFWNYRNSTKFYKGSCGTVFGSAGDFWPPPRFRQDRIALFSPDLCRYINFTYKMEEEVGGVKGYRYDSGLNLFDNGTINSENQCFCNGKCSPSGSLNVTSCRFGAPAFVSYPHFYLADSSYLSPIFGMMPDFKKHDMYIILDQKWGIPLEVAVRLQINILLESDPGIRMLDGVPTIFFPMIWFQQKVTMPQKMQEELKSFLRLPKFGFICSIAFYVTGFSCLILYVMVEHFVRERKRGRALTLRYRIGLKSSFER